MHRLISSFRVSPGWTLSDPARSGDWVQRAKHLALRLGAYTPDPSNSSSNESPRPWQSVPVARPRRPSSHHRLGVSFRGAFRA